MRKINVFLTIILLILTVEVAHAGNSNRSLPYPYQHLEKPLTPHKKYLKSTPLIPDPEICEILLNNRLIRKSILQNSLKWKWVTDPILVEGSFGGFYAISELHITYKNKSSKIQQKTFSCFTRYAKKSETNVWKSGKIRYGSCLKKGHKRYITCSTKTDGEALPGKPIVWQEGNLGPPKQDIPIFIPVF